MDKTTAAQFLQETQAIKKEDLGEMHPMEIKLIQLIRDRYRYGEVTIKTRDGLPVLILKSTEYQGLS